MKGTRDLSNVYSLLESQLGAKRIREVDHDDAYAMITVKGKKKTVFFFSSPGPGEELLLFIVHHVCKLLYFNIRLQYHCPIWI